jgi:hypothetical protein
MILTKKIKLEDRSKFFTRFDQFKNKDEFETTPEYLNRSKTDTLIHWFAVEDIESKYNADKSLLTLDIRNYNSEKFDLQTK